MTALPQNLPNLPSTVTHLYDYSNLLCLPAFASAPSTSRPKTPPSPAPPLHARLQPLLCDSPVVPSGRSRDHSTPPIKKQGGMSPIVTTIPKSHLLRCSVFYQYCLTTHISSTLTCANLRPPLYRNEPLSSSALNRLHPTTDLPSPSRAQLFSPQLIQMDATVGYDSPAPSVSGASSSLVAVRAFQGIYCTNKLSTIPNYLDTHFTTNP